MNRTSMSSSNIFLAIWFDFSLNLLSEIVNSNFQSLYKLVSSIVYERFYSKKRALIKFILSLSMSKSAYPIPSIVISTYNK